MLSLTSIYVLISEFKISAKENKKKFNIDRDSTSRVCQNHKKKEEKMEEGSTKHQH